MSPQTSRYSTPATGDAAADPGGRHRRPESLADVSSRSPARETGSRVIRPRTSIEDTSTPVERHRSSHAAESFIERGFDPPAIRSSRHQRNLRAGRHAAVRPPVSRPPATGSHRAPGTLPIESWLLMGKTRQQVLLASLVAVGLVLLALPAEQRQSGVDAVNAAAQRAVGAETAKTQPAKKTAKPANDDAPAAPNDEPEPTASATAHSKTPVVTTTGAVTAAADKGAGPGHSLRTTGSKAIALTFDDGPDPVQTPRILAMLDKYQLKATFCLVGQQVEKHPEIVRQIVAAGHTLCNHTWDHSLTIGQDKPEKIQADLARTNAAIRSAVPDAKIPFFRAPGGNFSDRLVGVAAGDGMTSLYWEVDPRDWDHPEGETAGAHVDRVIEEIRKHIRPGSIVLSHDFNQPDTIEAYEKLLPWLKANFTIGMPGAPTPAETPTTGEPDPTETPATPAPTVTTTPPPTATY